MLGSPSVPPLLQYTGRISAGENEMQYLPMAAKRDMPLLIIISVLHGRPNRAMSTTRANNRQHMTSYARDQWLYLGWFPRD